MASKQDSTGGTTPAKGEAVRTGTEPSGGGSRETDCRRQPEGCGARSAQHQLGDVRSSDDSVPDLWFGEPTEERRDATCSAEVKRNEGCGDGPEGLPAPDKVRKLQITMYPKAKSKPEYRFWSR